MYVSVWCNILYIVLLLLCSHSGQHKNNSISVQFLTKYSKRELYYPSENKILSVSQLSLLKLNKSLTLSQQIWKNWTRSFMWSLFNKFLTSGHSVSVQPVWVVNYPWYQLLAIAVLLLPVCPHVPACLLLW